MKVADARRTKGISPWSKGLGLEDDDIMSKGRDPMIFPIFFEKMQEISDINKATQGLHRVPFPNILSLEDHDINKRIGILVTPAKQIMASSSQGLSIDSPFIMISNQQVLVNGIM